MKMEQISLVPIYMNGLMLCKILVYRRSRYALSTTYDCSTTINFLAVLLNSSSSNPTIDSLALPGCQQTELQKINKAYLWPRSKCWMWARKRTFNTPRLKSQICFIYLLEFVCLSVAPPCLRQITPSYVLFHKRVRLISLLSFLLVLFRSDPWLFFQNPA